jgi:superfamily I DNA/RNA helicase
MTYHSAKGLTFDSVLLPHLGKDWFPRAKWADIERLIFVGITRATKWVFLSSLEDGAFKPLEKIVPLAANGSLSIQRSGDRTEGSRSSGREKTEEEDIIDIL